MTAGLTAHGVSHATASHLAHLPPVGLLFAAFLGFNPIQKLLGASTLSHLTPAQVHTLTGRSFFPHLISGPFIDSMAIVFVAALVMCMIAAVASWSRGAAPVIFSDEETGPFGAPGGEGIEALDATPLAEEWTAA
jgi:hypothetical protein